MPITHSAVVSIASNNGGEYYGGEDSVQTSVTPSVLGDSSYNSATINTQSPHRTGHRGGGGGGGHHHKNGGGNSGGGGSGDHPFSQYAPVCLYVFKQDTFPRNWCLKMISNPYPFPTRATSCFVFHFDYHLHYHFPITTLLINIPLPSSAVT